MARAMFLLMVVVLLAAPAAASDQGPQTKMKMKMPDMAAQVEPTREAYTENRKFLVKLLAAPDPIPYQRYFTIRLGIYDGAAPHGKLSDVSTAVVAGMRHGHESGFAHGMNSSPKVETKAGIVEADGMYFHMRGVWVVKVTVTQGSTEDVAYLRLPCCGK
jgi:hypothetical protein